MLAVKTEEVGLELDPADDEVGAAGALELPATGSE